MIPLLCFQLRSSPMSLLRVCSSMALSFSDHPSGHGSPSLKCSAESTFASGRFVSSQFKLSLFGFPSG